MHNLLTYLVQEVLHTRQIENYMVQEPVCMLNREVFLSLLPSITQRIILEYQVVRARNAFTIMTELSGMIRFQFHEK